MSEEKVEVIDAQHWKEEVPKGDIGKLVGALALAQAEFKPVTKDTVNPFFKSKYADLATIISATQPALAKNGLVVLQIAKVDEHAKQAGVRTILAHSSGQTIEAELMLPAAQGTKFDAQTVGSAITYSRRYAMQSILGVSADADDDANAASGNSGSREQAQAVGAKKVAELKAKKNPTAPTCLFYVMPEEHNGHQAELINVKEYGESLNEVAAEGLRMLLKKYVHVGKKSGELLVAADKMSALAEELQECQVDLKELPAARQA